MKIWITRQNAGSVTVGGLKRLQIWFFKPVWIERTIYHYESDPWGGSILEGYYSGGAWEIRSGGTIERGNVAFGCVFGCNDTEDDKLNNISLFVWQRLCEHFKNTEMHEWPDLEQSGKSKQQDFFLELDLQIDFIKPIK